MTEDLVRVLRVIEYTGERAAVERQLKRSLPCGEHNYVHVIIKVATLGTFPEILQRAEERAEPDAQD